MRKIVGYYVTVRSKLHVLVEGYRIQGPLRPITISKNDCFQWRKLGFGRRIPNAMSRRSSKDRRIANLTENTRLAATKTSDDHPFWSKTITTCSQDQEDTNTNLSERETSIAWVASVATRACPDPDR